MRFNTLTDVISAEAPQACLTYISTRNHSQTDMDKHKYFIDSALYLKFRLHLTGTDLNGLSLNAAYESKECASGQFHCFTQYIRQRFPTHTLTLGTTWRMRNVVSR